LEGRLVCAKRCADDCRAEKKLLAKRIVELESLIEFNGKLK